jgi:hypothetical protein
MAGAWGSSSQDFVRLAGILFRESERCAKSLDGNCSIHVLAGIPMLFSAIRCVLIELHAGMWGNPRSNASVLIKLAGAHEVKFILDHYSVSSELAAQISTLNEVRNEIVHPAHRPGAERNNTPVYLSTLRQSGLLQSTSKETDYIWIAQLQSHRLFRWAFETVAAIVNVLISAHQVPDYVAVGLCESYSRYISATETR